MLAKLSSNHAELRLKKHGPDLVAANSFRAHPTILTKTDIHVPWKCDDIQGVCLELRGLNPADLIVLTDIDIQRALEV